VTTAPRRRPTLRPTLRDVAKAAGVSFKTVSRVVNGESGVSDDIVTRVRRQVETLGYVPDERARNLRQFDSRPNSVGFVMVDVANPFFSAILRGLEDVARANDCLVLAASSDGDPHRQDQLIDTFLQRRVAGIVVVPCVDHFGPLDSQIIRSIPVVYLDGEPGEHTRDIVRTDHYGGAKAMAEHLMRFGHRDIGFLGDDPEVFSAGLRLRGYRDIMASHGLAVRDDWVLVGQHDQVAWHGLVRDWLAGLHELPTAVLTAQNFVTIGAVRALHEANLADKIALVGFDEVELSDVVRPGISTLPQHPQNLGKRAGQLLFDRIAASDGPPIRDIWLPQVVSRGSGELQPFR
jgi:LacI family transcriptional regulator